MSMTYGDRDLMGPVIPSTSPSPPVRRASPERRPPAAAGTQRANRMAPAYLQRRMGNRGVSAALRQGAAGQRRECHCDGASGASEMCTECAQKRSAVQRDPIQAGGPSHLPPSVTRAIDGGGGERLPEAHRAHMESALGADLGGVRIHRDPDAAHAANDISAHAFTVGQDIYFGSGQYDPGSTHGNRLLAHELTHTLQQASGTATTQTDTPISSPTDPLEREAETVAANIDNPSPGTNTAKATSPRPAGPPSLVQRSLFDDALDFGADIVDIVGSAGSAVVEGLTTAGGAVGGAVGADLLALKERVAALRKLLHDYEPLPEGLIRLKEQMIGEKERLLALDDSLKEQSLAASLPIAAPVPPVGAGGVSAGGGSDDFGTAAGGCGLCYGEGKDKVGPREAGTAVHRVVQNIMIATPGVVAELPLGNGRIDLAVVDPVQKIIHIGEIKPANSAGIEAGIKQIEARLRVLPTLAAYANYTAVQLKAPVRQPIRFETGAPYCLEQPGFCFSQSLSVAGPTGGLYLYFCEPSYSELLSNGCKCKCREPEPHPLPVSRKDKEKAGQPSKINWGKVATYGMIAAMVIALIAAVICAFTTTATVVGIPLGMVCAGAGLAAATAMLALIVKARNEPDTTA